eukprot:CAMPEP_0170527088 /NCGR_PEP_ID=MMETSP0209-20121228/12533_1 /TAXON_ID=665100 ORGANISM="Litonotus pictus, Strain P1" /NCGR_SAMPLE_ID=MMETSP0209 /ASSEMBLY_ACC=CAM_ASM_000301 /LENGTH=250 /DNA_ID=CAMNT_0010817359 /DNA_START=1657 /DNA_END=2406 /DNA_ORIENTATION=-
MNKIGLGTQVIPKSNNNVAPEDQNFIQKRINDLYQLRNFACGLKNPLSNNNIIDDSNYKPVTNTLHLEGVKNQEKSYVEERPMVRENDPYNFNSNLGRESQNSTSEGKSHNLVSQSRQDAKNINPNYQRNQETASLNNHNCEKPYLRDTINDQVTRVQQDPGYKSLNEELDYMNQIVEQKHNPNLNYVYNQNNDFLESNSKNQKEDKRLPTEIPKNIEKGMSNNTEQFKLDSSSKEYLFKKLNEMKKFQN